MNCIAVLVILGGIWTVHSEEHSLSYIYTAFSKPANLPGIHDFTAMGMMDGRMIDYYDSLKKEKVPKQDWMRERLGPDYWDKGTRSRQSKEQWFKINIDILMKRMRQNNTDTHILQWRHGCKVDKQSDGSTKFLQGMDMYSYDGNDFLSFDDANKRWIAPAPQARPTKTKWDEVQVLNDYTKGYLEKECVEWLEKFLEYGKEQLKGASPPEVYLWKKTSKTQSTILTCMATGFYPKDIVLQIKRGDRILDHTHGVISTGVLPNDDHTHQVKKSVAILSTDISKYTCEVIHHASNIHIVMEWDVNGSDSLGLIVGASVGVLVLLLLAAIGVGVFLLLRRIRANSTNNGSVFVINNSGYPYQQKTPLMGPSVVSSSNSGYPNQQKTPLMGPSVVSSSNSGYPNQQKTPLMGPSVVSSSNSGYPNQQKTPLTGPSDTASRDFGHPSEEPLKGPSVVSSSNSGYPNQQKTPLTGPSDTASSNSGHPSEEPLKVPSETSSNDSGHGSEEAIPLMAPDADNASRSETV